MLEMLADPFGDRTIAGRSIKSNQGRVNYLVEICDPSEAFAFSYTVDDLPMSDFYTPSFFDPVPAVGVRYSLTGAITSPRQVLKGGYLELAGPDQQPLVPSELLRPTTDNCRPGTDRCIEGEFAFASRRDDHERNDQDADPYQGGSEFSGEASRLAMSFRNSGSVAQEPDRGAGQSGQAIVDHCMSPQRKTRSFRQSPASCAGQAVAPGRHSTRAGGDGQPKRLERLRSERRSRRRGRVRAGRNDRHDRLAGCAKLLDGPALRIRQETVVPRSASNRRAAATGTLT